jgi:hypothetical protein
MGLAKCVEMVEADERCYKCTAEMVKNKKCSKV